MVLRLMNAVLPGETQLVLWVDTWLPCGKRLRPVFEACGYPWWTCTLSQLIAIQVVRDKL
jgi:hypothetical protein